MSSVGNIKKQMFKICHIRDNVGEFFSSIVGKFTQGSKLQGGLHEEGGNVKSNSLQALASDIITNQQ